MSESIAAMDLEEIIQNILKQDTRWDAILELKLLTYPKLASELEEYIEHKSWVIRWCVAEKMGDLKDIRSLKFLVKTLYDKDPHVRHNGLKAIKKFGKTGIPYLAKLCRTQNLQVRKEVKKTLLSYGPSVAPFLAAEIKGEDWVIDNHLLHLITELNPDNYHDLIKSVLNKSTIQRNALVLISGIPTVKYISQVLALYSTYSLRQMVLRYLKKLPPQMLYPELKRLYLEGEKPFSLNSGRVMIKIGRPILKVLTKALLENPKLAPKLCPVLDRIGPEPVMKHIHQKAKSDSSFGKATRDFRMRHPHAI